MKATVEIDAGVCGFQTKVVADCDDSQNVSFEIETDCEKIQRLADYLAEGGEVDAYGELGQANQSRLLSGGQVAAAGCCGGCAVLAGLFKSMQVAAGLALPKDVSIKMSKE